MSNPSCESVSLSTLLKDPIYSRLWDEDVAKKILKEIYNRLNDNQRELIQALSIFREAVPLDAVQLLLNATNKTQVLPFFRTLLARKLVQVVENGHYQLHAIVATYAQQHYDEQFNKEGPHIAHGKAAQYYIQQAAKKCPPREKRKRILDVQPLIEAVWQFCQAEQWQEAYEVMEEECLFEHVRRWGGNIILLEIGQNLLMGVSLLDTIQIAFVNYQLGKAFNSVGKKEEALKYYQQSLKICREQKKLQQEGAILTSLGALYSTLGQKEQALTHYKQALDILREVEDRWGEGATLNNLGAVNDDLGQKEQALTNYQQALDIRKEVGDRGGEGTTLNNMGRLYRVLGQKEKVLTYYKQALDIHREVGDRWGEGTTLHNIGAIYYEEKRFDIALSCFILAKCIFVEV